MIRLLQSPTYALALLVALTAILHVALVRARPQSSMFWKRIDYVWLTLVGVGLLSGAGDVQRFIRSNAVDVQVARAAFDFRFLKDHVEAAEAVYCRASRAGQKATGALDEGERERVQLCRWYGEIRLKLPDKVGPDLPQIVLPEAGKGPESQSAQASVRKILRSYEDSRAEMVRMRQGAERTGLDSLLLALGPLALTGGLALRLTKATAEVRIERDRRRSRRIFAREDED
jgi:hypothetical protein